jgi:hypothetical protein
MGALRLPALFAAVLLAAGAARALTYQVTPVNLAASGFTFTGTVTTDDTIGALAAENLVDWNILVSGPLTFTITPANSHLNDTVFRLVSATADEIRVAFPEGNFQFNLEGPFTSTVPACGNCDEGGVQLFRSDFGRNHQGISLQDFTDQDPDFSDFQTPVVTGDATFYVAATIVPEPAGALLLGLGALGFFALRRRRQVAPASPQSFRSASRSSRGMRRGRPSSSTMACSVSARATRPRSVSSR